MFPLMLPKMLVYDFCDILCSCQVLILVIYVWGLAIMFWSVLFRVTRPEYSPPRSSV